MGLIASIRRVVRKSRPVVYRLPVLGKGLRYLKRVIVLPWNFHKHYQAAGEFRVHLHNALHAQRAYTTDLANAQTHALACHLSDVLWDIVPGLVTEHLQKSVSDPVQRMISEFRLGLLEMAGELRGLNERHATCYDRLAEQLRLQTEQLRALAEGQAAGGAEELARQLADLAAAQESLSAQVAELRAGEAARLRLTA